MFACMMFVGSKLRRRARLLACPKKKKNYVREQANGQQWPANNGSDETEQIFYTNPSLLYGRCGKGNIVKGVKGRGLQRGIGALLPSVFCLVCTRIPEQ